MEKDYFSPERKLERFVNLQYNILKSGYPLEEHLKTIKRLPSESRLRNYERLYKGKWINEEQYNNFIKKEHDLTLRNFLKN